MVPLMPAAWMPKAAVVAPLSDQHLDHSLAHLPRHHPRVTCPPPCLRVCSTSAMMEFGCALSLHSRFQTPDLRPQTPDPGPHTPGPRPISISTTCFLTYHHYRALPPPCSMATGVLAPYSGATHRSLVCTIASVWWDTGALSPPALVNLGSILNLGHHSTKSYQESLHTLHD